MDRKIVYGDANGEATSEADIAKGSPKPAPAGIGDAATIQGDTGPLAGADAHGDKGDEDPGRGGD